MPTSYINTGVLGSLAGGSLGTGGLTMGQQYQQLAGDIQRKKRTLSAPSKAELDAARQRRDERRAQSLIDTALTTPTGEQQARLAAPVDTADIKVPSIKVDSTAPAEVQNQQQAANLASLTTASIVKNPTVAAPAPAPAQPVVHPGRDLSAETQAFARAYQALSERVGSKVGTGRVKGASSSITGQYNELMRLAQATGNQTYIDLTQKAGAGINYAQKSISSQNIAKAYGNLSSGMTSLRDSIDFEWLKSQAAVAAPAVKVGVNTPLTKILAKRG